MVKVKNVPKRQVYVSPEWYKSAAEGQQPGYEHVFLAEVAYGKTENDKAYNEAHIPGAVHINSDAVEYDDWNLDGIDDQQLYEETEVKPEDNFNIRSAKQLGEFLKNNGITKDTKVVLYGRSASDSSVTRVAFAMLYAGVEDKRDPNKVYDKLENDMRVGVSLPVYYKEGTGLLKNVNIKLVSPLETLECTTGENGRLQTELLEDQNYMVIVESEQWDIDSFPLVAKDKSEYGAGRYAYNHSSCAKVDELRLVDKNETHHSDTILVSKSGDTSVTGINFKDMLLYEKSLSKDLVSELPNKDYEVLDISVVNPHRWERAKLAAGDFTVTRKVPQGKAVKKVYYIDENKQLQEIPFTNEDGKACFTMHSLGIHHVVIEYEKKSVPLVTKVSKVKVTGGSKEIAAGKKIQLKAKISPVKATNKKVKWTTSNKKYATVTSTGKVTVNKAGAGKKVTIKATAVDGSKKADSYTIRIRKHAVKKITLKASGTLKNGKATTVKATVQTTGKDANKKLAWSSSNSKYVTVTAKGKVTAKKAGKGKTVKITAKATDGSGIKKIIKIKIK